MRRLPSRWQPPHSGLGEKRATRARSLGSRWSIHAKALFGREFAQPRPLAFLVSAVGVAVAPRPVPDRPRDDPAEGWAWLDLHHPESVCLESEGARAGASRTALPTHVWLRFLARSLRRRATYVPPPTLPCHRRQPEPPMRVCLASLARWTVLHGQTESRQREVKRQGLGARPSVKFTATPHRSRCSTWSGRPINRGTAVRPTHHPDMPKPDSYGPLHTRARAWIVMGIASIGVFDLIWAAGLAVVPSIRQPFNVCPPQ
ncbi:hypothetical protein EDF18_2210 [Frigoribacterium sp. PhB107]|nr:hypothetical protein EDF18_2210 [Frigoribacterium sp. PhB107]